MRWVWGLLIFIACTMLALFLAVVYWAIEGPT